MDINLYIIYILCIIKSMITMSKPIIKGSSAYNCTIDEKKRFARKLKPHEIKDVTKQFKHCKHINILESHDIVEADGFAYLLYDLALTDLQE